MCLFTCTGCVDIRSNLFSSPFSFCFSPWISVALSGARDGSVQSDASSSPSEQSQLGQSHPGYHMGPQVREKIN